MMHKLPLRCEAKKSGVLSISVGKYTLAFAARAHPDLYDDDGNPRLKVTNYAVFLREVVRAINEEGEDGSTLLTDMLDKAILSAVENGCEGVELT